MKTAKKKQKKGLNVKKLQQRISYEILPVIALFVVWPLIVHMDTVKTWLGTKSWFPNLIYQEDFFMHCRSITLLLIALWMLFLMRDFFFGKDQRKLLLRLFWPLGMYGILTVVSTIFSQHKGFALFGMQEQYESVFVLLAYVIVAVYFYYITKKTGSYQWIIYLLLVGAALQAGIGLSQFVGYDFWNTAVGQWLILFGRDSGQTLGYNFAESTTNSVYLSFYNPNYAAVYLILVLPVCAFAFLKEKRKKYQILFVFLFLALLVCLWGTGSKAGFITIVILTVIGGVLYLYTKRQKICYLVVLAAGLAIFTAVGTMMSGTSIFQRIYKSVFPKQTEYSLEQVNLLENSVQITYDGKQYFMILEREDGATYFSVTDESGNTYPMEYDTETERFSLLGDKNVGLEFEAYTSEGNFWMVFYQGKIPWYFKKEKDGEQYQYITLYEKADVPENAEYAFGKGYEKALTNRIYLWSRTVPLLKDYIVWGSGPDSFTMMFPQNDYVMRANLGIDMLMSIISRAHSFYLQNWLQTGLLSLIAILFFGGRCLVRLLRKRRGNRNGTEGIFLAILGFFIMGITNDSVVVVSPIFWALLGFGYAMTEK